MTKYCFHCHYYKLGVSLFSVSVTLHHEAILYGILTRTTIHCQGTTTSHRNMTWPPHTRPRGSTLTLQSPSSASLQGDIPWYLNWWDSLYEINEYVFLVSVILWGMGWFKEFFMIRIQIFLWNWSSSSRELGLLGIKK